MTNLGLNAWYSRCRCCYSTRPLHREGEKENYLERYNQPYLFLVLSFTIRPNAHSSGHGRYKKSANPNTFLPHDLRIPTLLRLLTSRFPLEWYNYCDIFSNNM